MTLISKLILGPTYRFEELYTALRRRGETDRTKDSGLGEIIDSNETLVKEAFSVTNKAFVIKNADKVYELAQAFRNGTKPARHVNLNKYAICLALIYRNIIDTKKQEERSRLLVRVVNELSSLLGKNGKLQNLVMESNDKSRMLEQLAQIKPQPEKSEAKLANNNSVSLTSKAPSPHPSAELIEPPASPLALSIPAAAVEAPPVIIPAEEKKSETYLEILNKMKEAGKDVESIPAKKTLQRKYFESEIKKNNLSLGELEKLLEYMHQIQDGSILIHPFHTIRAEQSYIFGGIEWNTQSWQNMVYEVKQCLMEALINLKSSTNPPTRHVTLPDEEYNKYHRLFAKHSARFLHWYRTNSVTDFENTFKSQSEINQQAMLSSHLANNASPP